jgi:NADH-quinone oxidoreductase subunit J
MEPTPFQLGLQTVLFGILAAVAVVGALVTITRRHPLPAALSLIVTFIGLAGLYALLAAPLLAILQILVYAGAIMALVTFVLMLLNVQEGDLPVNENIGKAVSLALAAVTPVLLIVLYVFGQLPQDATLANTPVAADFGTIEVMGKYLYTNYLFAFEAVAVLLTAALVGVVILAKRRI